MKFVSISDTHCRHRNLKLPKGDVIIHAGDISNRGDKSEVIDFLAWFGKLNYKYKIFIAGNHDFFFEKNKLPIIEKLVPPDVIYLKDSGIVIEGLSIWGSPVTPWFFNWAFNKHRGAAIRKHWNLIPTDTDVLITHGPPYGILDAVINQRRAGCKDLLEKVQEIKPKVHVFGHIHESYGMQNKGGIKFINGCLLNEGYELVNKPITFEL